MSRMLDSGTCFSGVFFNEIIAAESARGTFGGAARAGPKRVSGIARRLDSNRSFLGDFLNEIIRRQREGAQSQAWPLRRRGVDRRGVDPSTEAAKGEEQKEN